MEDQTNTATRTIADDYYEATEEWAAKMVKIAADHGIEISDLDLMIDFLHVAYHATGHLTLPETFETARNDVIELIAREELRAIDDVLDWFREDDEAPLPEEPPEDPFETVQH
jgi:hypothetical protein